MAQQRIRGTTQIIDATINAAKFVASLNLPTNQLQDGALFLKSDGTISMTAALNANSQKIINLATPTAAGDAVNKAYADSIAAGIDPKGSVRVISTTNLALTGLQTIDGVTVVANDRVLLAAQTTASQNGIWLAQAAAWTRPTDYPAASATAVTAGAFTFVEEGTANQDSGWVLTTNGAITVDTTATAWTQFSGAGSITAGNGLTKTGNTLAVGAGNGIAVAAGSTSVLANGSSLNVSGSGVKISDGTAGQVMLAAPLAGFVTLSGDITSVSAAGAVTVSSSLLRAANFVTNEIPAGTINGANTAFTLAFTPIAGTAEIYQNGLRLLVGAGNDYTISGGTVTFITPPVTGDNLLVDYQK